jgi:hypothetical protein
MADGNGSGRDEARRFREAANDALQQLDWCIGYLHGIGKLEISKALSRNRSFIREQLLNREAQPLPTSEVDEEQSA